MSGETPRLHKQRLDDHPVHGTISSWIDRIRKEKPDAKKLSQDSREILTRLRWVLRELRQRLSNTEPFLVHPNVLTAINKRVTGLQSSWEQFLADPTANAQQLDGYTDSILDNLERIGNTGRHETWREFFNELRIEMSQVIDSARDTTASTQATSEGGNRRLGELADEIKSQKKRLDQALTQQTEAFTHAEQERVSQYSQAEQSRLDRFNDLQQSWKEEFDTAIEQWDEKTTEVIKLHRKSFEEANESTRQESKSRLDDLQSQLDKAEEIVGTIVKTTMSGNYQVIANREYKNAWWMRLVAILAFIAMGGMIIWAASSIKFGENGIDATTLAFRSASPS